MKNTAPFAMRAIALPVGVAAGLLILAGCAGYHLGGTPPPGVRSVCVPTFINHCGEPNIELDTTRSTIQEFQKDGNLSIKPEDQADAVLRVTLISYRLEPLRYDRNTGKTAREYRVILSAKCTLESKKEDNKILSSRKISGDATFEYSGDLTTARFQALPLVAQDLARNIVDSVVSFW